MNPPAGDGRSSGHAHDMSSIAEAVACASSDLSDFVVVFHRAQTRLVACELAELRRWVSSWSSADRPCYLVLGCCADTSCEDRARRLQELVEHVVACGVPHDMIRYTGEWVAPPLTGDGTALPEDVVWLKAVDAAHTGRGATSIRGLFSAGQHGGRLQRRPRADRV